MSKDCKHCNEANIFPEMVQSLRSTLRTNKIRMAANFFRCEEDKGFEEIQNAEYCCSGAKYDAEDAYNKHFPYNGMADIEGSIQCLYESFTYLKKAFGNKKLTAEKFMEMELDTYDGEIAQHMQSIEFRYKSLIELSYNLEQALKRETDPEKRKLLDGRNSEERTLTLLKQIITKEEKRGE